MNDSEIDKMMRMDDLSRCDNNSLMRLSEYERSRLYGIGNTVKYTDTASEQAQRNAAFAEEMRRMRKLDDETEENLAAEYAKVKHEVQLRKAIEQRRELAECQKENNATNLENCGKNKLVENLEECYREREELIEQQNFREKELFVLQKELCAIEAELEKRKALCKTAVVLPHMTSHFRYTNLHNEQEQQQEPRKAHDQSQNISRLQEREISNKCNNKYEQDRMRAEHLKYEPVLNATCYAPYLTLHSDGEFTRYEAVHSRLPAQRSVESSIKRCLLSKEDKRSKHYPQPSPFHTHEIHSSFSPLEKWQRHVNLPDVN